MTTLRRATTWRKPRSLPGTPSGLSGQLGRTARWMRSRCLGVRSSLTRPGSGHRRRRSCSLPLAAALTVALLAAACGSGGETSVTEASPGQPAAPASPQTPEDAASTDADPTEQGDPAGTDSEAPLPPNVTPTLQAPGSSEGVDPPATSATGGEGTQPPAPPPPEPPPPPPEPQPTIGFDGSSIKLGYLTDFTGSLAILGIPLLSGAQAYWAWVNDSGGIAGKYPVELITGDTKDQVDSTITEYQRIKGDVVMFAEVLSTPPTQALLEFLKEDGVVAVPGSLAGAWAREPLLLPTGAAYEYEAINLADWYLNASGMANPADVYCVVYVNDKYGRDSLEGLEFAMENLGLELVERQTINRGDRAFTAQVTAFSDAGCTVIFALTVPVEQNSILAEAQSQGLEPVWLGLLPTYLNILGAGRPDLWANYYVAIDSPNLNDTSVPGMAKFLERYEQYGEGTVDTFKLSGYVQSIAVHALLELAAQKGDFSREGIRAAMAELGEVELEGLMAENYVYGTPENRRPASAVRIFQYDQTQPPNFLREIMIWDSQLTEEFAL